MINYDELAELVEKAKLGDKECLNRLAEAAEVRLREYVFRLTLEEDLTQDIVQESILEMFRVFHKLKKTERFWSWLYGIAFNKVRSHYGRQWRHKTKSLSEAGFDIPARDSQNALAGMINRELKQVVIRSMQELAPRHRAVLTMRCYERMPYSKIAAAMGCTEFGAQSLFYRAKKSLAKKLSNHGLGEHYLPAGLILFGKMTATTEAAAAKVSVTSATLKVGAAASAAAMVTSKTAVISLAAAGVIAGGTAATRLGTAQRGDQPQSAPDTSWRIAAENGMERCWYFFPEGAGKPVMTRLVGSDGPGKSTYCRLLQNQHANYYYDNSTISIENFRMYNPDLSVRRLPTDSEGLTRFISAVEGKQVDMEYVSAGGRGLLVISKRSGDQGNKLWRIDRHFNVLEEEYFQYDWPASATVADNRDTMHRRGWTYFRISGQVNGEPVSGAGRMPFVYETSKKFSPWLELTLANGVKFMDSGARACVLEGGGDAVTSYEGGSFFKGLGRPWMGLHTIDTVRRDAAEQRIRYETAYSASGAKVEVVLTCEQARFVYVIDMRTDVVEEITVTRNDGGRAELEFSYLQDIAGLETEFTRPSARGNQQTRQESPGILWLATLAENRR